MECPHCNQETSPTYLYCERCGEQLELDLEAVRQTMERDSVADAIEMAEKQTRSALYLVVFLLVSVIAFRFVALRPVVADAIPGYYAPYKLIEDKGLEPPASLEVTKIPLEIPGD
jgi:hypothetical protein